MIMMENRARGAPRPAPYLRSSALLRSGARSAERTHERNPGREMPPAHVRGAIVVGRRQDKTPAARTRRQCAEKASPVGTPPTESGQRHPDGRPCPLAGPTQGRRGGEVGVGGCGLRAAPDSTETCSRLT